MSVATAAAQREPRSVPGTICQQADFLGENVMPGLLKTHLLRSSVGDLVEGLRFVEPEIIGKTRVLEYLPHIKLSPEAVAPYKQLGSTQ